MTVMANQRKQNNGKEDLSRNLLTEFGDYCKEHILYIFILAVITAAVYGMWCCQDLITFDAEGFYNTANAHQWYEQWIKIGRWGFYFLKKILGVYLINPYFSVTVFLICFPLSSLLWSFACHIWNGRRSNPASVLIFGVIYLTHPIWALQFSYRNQMEVCSICLVVLPIGMLLLTEWFEKRKILLLILSFLIITYCFGCYQAFMLLYAEAVGIYFFYQMLNPGMQAASARRVFWMRFLKTAVFTAASYAAYSLISSFVRFTHGLADDNTYLDRQFLWTTTPFTKCIANIASFLKKSFFGDGTVYSVLYMAVVLVFAVWMVSVWFRRKPYRVLSLLIGLYLIFCPFILEFATADNIVSRSQFSFVLALAFFGMLDCEWLSGLIGSFSKKAAPIIIFILMAAAITPQVEYITRLLYTDSTAMTADKTAMDEIYYTAMKKGAKATDAICFIGEQSFYKNNAMTKDYEVIGFSYFEVVPLGSRKTVDMMNAMGYPFVMPTNDQTAEAKTEAADMAIWPSDDSIRVKDDIVIVRLS